MDRQVDNPNQSFLVVVGTRLAKNPKVQVSVGLWAIGMLLVLFASSPVTLSPETERAFYAKLETADAIPSYELEKEVASLQAYVYEAKVWFWSFNEETKKEVERRQEILNVAQGKLNQVYEQKREITKDAKASIGVWSQYSIDEARHLFWNSYESAKDFVKRMTFYDVIFGMFRGRDESMVAFCLKWIFQITMNITFGAIGCVIGFMWSLSWMVWEFSPTLLSGLGFIILAMLGCLSFVFTILMAVFGTAFFAGYTIVKQAAHQQIEEGDRQGGYRRPIEGYRDYDNRGPAGEPDSYYGEDRHFKAN